MSGRPPKLDSAALDAAFGSKVPDALTREGRVKLLGEAAEALLAGRTPSREAALFLAGGLLSWLREGGDLVRDFWKIVKPKSHHTPAFLWQQWKAHPDERNADEDAPE